MLLANIVRPGIPISKITMNNQVIQMFPSVQEHVNVAPASATTSKHMLRCIRLTNPSICFCGSKAECLLHQRPHPTTCLSATQRLLVVHGKHPHASVCVQDHLPPHQQPQQTTCFTATHGYTLLLPASCSTCHINLCVQEHSTRTPATTSYHMLRCLRKH